MAWISVQPENQGGGRQPKTPTARLYSTGQFVLSHAAVALLGDPHKVRVQIEPELKRIRLQPATPNDNGAFTLSGGGNSPHRISFMGVAKKYPELVGAYRVIRAAGGIECVWEEEG